MSPGAKVRWQRRKIIAWASVAFGVAACGGKDHPAQVPDDPHGGTTTTGTTTGGGPDSGTDAGFDAGPRLGPSALFEKCYADVLSQRGILADPWFCFATTQGNPAENSVIRNLLYPKIGFEFTLDDAHRTFQSRMSAYWIFDAAGPDGQALTPGGTIYSTTNNDGTSIGFVWDKGDCGTSPQVGAFQVFELSWDATNKVDKVAIDFEHHCGDLPPLYGRLRFHSNIPP